jgi:hypothetical protein
VISTIAVLMGGTDVAGTDEWAAFSGPASFGTGGYYASADGSGAQVGFDGEAGYIFLPAGYVSGSSLTTSTMWPDATFASLGITPGTYTYTWGAGPVADSLTLNAYIAVPEPSTWVMFAGGAAMLLVFRRRP